MLPVDTWCGHRRPDSCIWCCLLAMLSLSDLFDSHTLACHPSALLCPKHVSNPFLTYTPNSTTTPSQHPLHSTPSFLLLAVVGVESAVEESGERWLSDTIDWVNDYYYQVESGVTIMSQLPYYSGSANQTLQYIQLIGNIKNKIFSYRDVIEGAQRGR